MTEKHLHPIPLPTAEVPPTPAEHGEKTQRGKIVATLPADMKPCPVVYDDNPVTHDRDCLCGGTNMVPIRKPAGEGLDPADDSLTALEEELEPPTCAGCERADCGDCNRIDASTMQRENRVAGGGGGGSGRKKTKRLTTAQIASAVQRSTFDGRVERTGRKPRFAKTGTRKDLIGTTVAPKTAQIIDAVQADAAALVESMLADPNFQSTLAEIKAAEKVVES